MVRLLQSYCNRSKETSDLYRLIADAERSHATRKPRAPVYRSPRAPRKMGKSVNQQIVDAYLDGKDVTPLSQQFGAAPSTIRRALDRLGVERRPIGLGQEQIDQILELRTLGWAQKQIADAVGCSEGTVFNVMHRQR